MSKTLQFKTFCFELYKAEKGMTGFMTQELFEKYKVSFIPTSREISLMGMIETSSFNIYNLIITTPIWSVYLVFYVYITTMSTAAYIYGKLRSVFKITLFSEEIYVYNFHINHHCHHIRIF